MLARELEAGDARHGVVGQHGVVAPRIGGERAPRLDRVGFERDLEPPVGKEVAHQLEHEVLVVHAQDAAAELTPPGAVAGPLGRSHRLAVRGREGDAETRARPRRALDEHMPAVLVNDAVDHGKAHAAALAHFLGGEERLEHALHHLGRDAGAGVAHRDFDEFAGEPLAAGGAHGAVMAHLRAPRARSRPRPPWRRAR